MNNLCKITRKVWTLTVLFAGLLCSTTSDIHAATQTYYISSNTQLINCASNCGTGSYYNPCTMSDIGFSWTDIIPAGNNITAVSIQFAIGVDCNGGTHNGYLNYVYQGGYNTNYYCNCSGNGTGIITINASASNYTRGGTNTFTTNSLGSCFGFTQDASLSNNFAIITVTYSPAVVPYKATWVSMNTGSAYWCAGETRNVTVTVTNSGTSTWTDAAPDVNLGCKWNADADYFVRVNAGNLSPNASQTYTFTMTAPSAGANNLSFNVVKESDCWFSWNSGNCGPGNTIYISSAITITSGVPGLAGLSSPSNGSTGHCPNQTTSLNWTAATGSPSGYKLYLGTDAAATNIINGTNIGNVLSYNPLPLTANTTYYWKIVPTNACGDAAGATIWSFTTGPICYCTSGLNTYGCLMYISNVNFGSINNTTGCSNSYGNYYTQSTVVTQGSTPAITLTSASYPMNWVVWIDFNDNGSFGDAGELVGSFYNSGALYTYTNNLTIPASAPAGTHRMRIMADYYGYAVPSTPCTAVNYSETEDYSVIVCNAPASPTPSTFGSSVWNVYAYSGTSLDLTGCSYAGWYSQSTLNYDTQTLWSNTSSPSTAAGYTGCTVSNDYHTVVYKRQDFPCGKYQIDVTGHDDNIRVYVNGAQVFEHVGCCDAHTNVWTGYLSTGSTVEVRHAEVVGGSQQSVNFTNVTPAIVNGSLTINGVTANANICVGSTITVTQGTGGSFPEASYYYWLGQENPAGSGWVTTWSIWNGSYQNNASPPSPPAFNTPGRYVVHTNAINNTCGWAYYGTGRTRYVDVIPGPTALTSATANPASVCLGSSSTLTSAGGLIAYYTFNNTLNDASGSGLNLTGSGGTLSASGLQLSTAASYSTTYTEALNIDKYTIDFYLQFNAAPDGNWGRIFGYIPSGTDRSPTIWRYPSANRLHWRHDPSNTGLTEPSVYTVGQWHHIVGEKNGATFTLYVDGVVVDQGTVANPKTSGQSPLWFGAASGFVGANNVTIKEFKIYNGILRWYTGSCGGTSVGSGPEITVTPATTTTYYLREEGVCSNTSCVSTTVTVVPPSTALGGPDQYVCGTSTTATMNASGSGTWTQVAGPNTPNIVNTSLATTQIGTTTPLITGTYVFRWTVGCGYDDVVIVKE